MANIVNRPTVTLPNDAAPPLRGIDHRLRSRIALGAILLLSIFMNFFQLGQNGYGNLYYAAGVRSMADSWHNFFFVSFDPGGFVTIDKPPVGFWLQTLSVKLFGFTPFSIFLPQAVYGVLAVLLLYALVRRHFGTGAGLIAALALAVSPISVVTNRNNTIDGTLALILLLAAWAVIHASETGKLRWLLLGGVFVGLGFNTKMSEAYLAVPALGAAYLFCAPRKLWTRIWHLLVVLIVMLAISLSWAATVDLTPTAQRPYVGSTKNNSEIGLALGYNGLNRLHIDILDINARNGSTTSNNKTTTNTGLLTKSGSRPRQLQTATTDNITTPDTTPDRTPGTTLQSTLSGSLRLFSTSFGSQIAWLLPFALLAIVALALRRRFNNQQKPHPLGLMLWGVWLLTTTVFFTLDNSFHQYYLTVMAPELCALVGIGLIVMWHAYRTSDWRGWLLPIALAITAVAQLHMLTNYPSWSQHLSPLIAILTTLVVVALLLFRLIGRLNSNEAMLPVASVIVGVGMFALLIAPTIWTTYSVIHNTESSAPIAGPGTQTNFSSFLVAHNQGVAITISKANRTLISYLEAHQGNTKFLVATPGSSTANPLILATNRPVMALGGFNGIDPILTVGKLQTLIKNGTVRFFLISILRTTTPGNALSHWVSKHCKAVPTKDWLPKSSRTMPGGNRLYDCSSAGV